MLILGLGGLGYRDSSAALVRDGRVLAAAAEDRFTRSKHQGGFPRRAVEACLRAARADIADVDHVAVANNPWLALRERVLDWYGDRFFESPEFRAYHIFHDELHSTLLYLKSLEDLRRGRDERFHVVPHHLSHMASSFLASPFEEAAILDVDGRGALSTSAHGVGRGAAIEVFGVQEMPNSLGLLYAAVSDYLGFSGEDDEFRVMSMSTQGTPKYRDQFREIVQLEPDGAFQLNDVYFTYRDGLAALSETFTGVFGVRRRRGDALLERHRDIAASLQGAIEDAVLHTATHLSGRTGMDAICVCGGVGLNWVVNGRLKASGPFAHVYVNPMAGDEGTAVGAALQVHAQQAGARPEALGSVALGPAAGDDEIEAVLRRSKQRYTRVADPAGEAARRIAEGEIVGWFQGRMEFGPRGLGQRAILADAGNVDVKQRMLRDVKPREEHHHFALSLAEESVVAVFGDDAGESPYLLLWNEVLEGRREELAGVVTRAGTARWQSVSHDREPLFHDLLTAFGERSGRLPGVINTSLNLPGRPPAAEPADALELFARTGIDALLMGAFLLTKA